MTRHAPTTALTVALTLAVAPMAAAQEARAATINYGLFINNVINSLIVACVIFLIVRQINAMKKAEEAAPPPPAGPTAEELLAEIRDLLKAQN